MAKKVFVSGCYDMLHSGHFAFFEEASQYGDFNVLEGTNLNTANTKDLADACEQVWEAINVFDLVLFAEGFTRSFEAQLQLFPNMLNDDIAKTINSYKNKALGWKLSGAGGYIIFISDKPIENGVKIKIRQK